MQALALYIGLPCPEAPVASLKARGTKIIFVLSSEEKKDFVLADDEAGVTWDDDVTLTRWLFDNMGIWEGAEVHGKDGERKSRFAGVLGDVARLMNFDNDSVQFLTSDKTPTRNAFKNFRHCEDGVPVRRAYGFAKGTACVIIAAGPSLNDQWKELKRFRDTAEKGLIFIVAGRSYTKAMKEGVIPDFVMEVEQFEWDDKLWHFAPMPPKQTILCGPLTACPGVFNAWPDQRQVMMLTDHNMAQIQGWKLYRESIDGGNSILHHMFELACWIGSNEIYLAGADLAYPEGSTDTHADGSFPSWPKDVLSLEHVRQEPLKVPCTSGGEANSSFPYRNFCIFLEMQIAKHRKGIKMANGKEWAIEAKPDLKVYNLSPHGQRIQGTEYRSIKECFLPPSSSPPASSLPDYCSEVAQSWGPSFTDTSNTFIPFESTPVVCELGTRGTPKGSKSGRRSSDVKTPTSHKRPRSKKT